MRKLLGLFFGIILMLCFIIAFVQHIAKWGGINTFIVVVLTVGLLIYSVWILPHQKWLSWSTLEQYRNNHPECKTNNGVKCYN